jgi:hypothetical protein
MLSPLPRRSGWADDFARNPAVSAFPERVVGSACASSFSRLARRSLALRPAHSRCHQFVTRIPKASASSLPPWLLRQLPAGAVAGWGLHPLESVALSRRTPGADIVGICTCGRARPAGYVLSAPVVARCEAASRGFGPALLVTQDPMQKSRRPVDEQAGREVDGKGCSMRHRPQA